MRATVCLATVCALATSSLAEDQAPFLSPGISVGFGTRGFTFGLEVSTGYFGGRTLAYGGIAAGFELAMPRDPREPWGRLYVEAEGGWAAFGVGFGQAWLLGPAGTQSGFQVTPYVAGARFGCDDTEPFVVVAPFYRYTRTDRRLHDGGLFVRGLWFVNGRGDHGYCD